MSSDDESFILPSFEATQAIIDGTTPFPALTTAPAATAAAAAPPAARRLPPLLEIFQDVEHFRKFTNTVGKLRAECLWCNKDIPYNATKLLSHVCGVSGQGVAICTAAIPEIHKQRYLDLLKRKEKGKNQRAGKFCLYLFVIFVVLLELILFLLSQMQSMH
jgi:hypothetical protein